MPFVLNNTSDGSTDSTLQCNKWTFREDELSYVGSDASNITMLYDKQLSALNLDSSSSHQGKKN